MKINNKLVISFVILVMGLSSLITIASAQEVSSEETIAILPICDHNNDGSRNLSDVAMFAECAETFDGNGDGVHDLSDISLYTSNNQDNTWCAAFVCGNEALSSVEVVEEPVAILPICDHNNDGSRNLSDVAMFAECAETFDADGNGRHDLADISLYTSNNQSNSWCATNFKCTPDPVAYSSETPFSGGSGTYQPQQLVGQQEPSPEPEVLGEKIEAEGEVLGEKIEAEEEVLEEVCTYNTPDTDVLGKTEWADGSLIRGCGPEVYIIENQQKRHIKSLEELFKYIGQRINNVTNDILNLF